MSFKKNIIYNTILRVLNVAFPIVTTPYVSRVLGVENIGIVNFTITYASYFVLFASLGIPLYGIREIARNKLNENVSKVFSEIFLISGLSTLFFSIIYILTIFLIPAFNDNRYFLLIAGLSIFFVPVNIDWFFAGSEQFKMLTVRSIIAKLLSIGGLFIFVKEREDVLPYLILIVIANLISQCWSFGHLIKSGIVLQLTNIDLKRHLKPIVILFFSSIAISIYTMLAPLLLGLFSSYTEVGYYTSANKASSMILPIVTSMSLVIVARINTLKEEIDFHEQVGKLLLRSFEFMLMMAIPACVGLILIAPRFVPLFFGEEFIPATRSLQLQSTLIVIIGVSNLFGTQVLVALGYEKKFLIAILIGTITNLCMNLLLIKPYGAFGASIASVTAETFVAIATSILALKVICIKINLKTIYQPIIASLVFVPVSLVLNDLIVSDLMYVIITGVISIALYSIILIYLLKHVQANQMFKMLVVKIGARV